jgi:hypothetical protein
VECLNENTLFEYAIGALKAHARLDVAVHVDECTCCREVVARVVENSAPSRTSTASTVPADSLERGLLRLLIPREAPVEQLPAQLGSYRIVSLLGAGGMGVVYRAEHVETGEPAAVKTVRLSYGSVVAGLRCEIHALTWIRHPGIVKILAEGVHDGLPWYAMELLSGRTLSKVIASRWADERAAPRPRAAAGDLPFVLGLARRICAPLGFLHGAGIVHRDLKPGNIFIRDDGSPVLMDFGLVSRYAGAIGREVIEVAGIISGTATYMSPEQTEGKPVDARSDLYSLGCVLYELTTGRPPFRGSNAAELVAQHLTDLPRPPSALVDGVPPELEALILNLLVKDPRQRIGHVDDVVAVLAALDGRDEPIEPAARPYLYRPRLAGRDQGLAHADELLARTRAGAGACLVVGGESGIGKTCFAAAVGALATRRRIRVVTGECFPLARTDGAAIEGRGAPLHPFRPLLQAIADLCREGGRDTTDAILGARGKVLATFEPLLNQLPGQDAHPEPAEVPPKRRASAS